MLQLRLRGRAKNLMLRQFHRMGLRITRMESEEKRFLRASYDASTPLPAGARETLRHDHPRLRELRAAYAALDLPVCRQSLWQGKRLARELTLPWFRGDNAYVWQYRQLRNDVRLKQYLVLRYVESRDDLGLLAKLGEDGAFGCWTFRYGRRPPVSRDLLESINEINFLHRHLGIADEPGLRVLDIGAGYGRLAHRMCDALPSLERYDCLDAVPESTFLCEFYLRHRGIEDRAAAIPLHELERLGPPGSYHLAVNIHSFSECPRAAISWWLDRIAELRVPYLLIVPNHPEALLSTEPDERNLDFAPDLEAHGYELLHKAPVYDDEELRELIGVRDHFFLYRRRDG